MKKKTVIICVMFCLVSVLLVIGIMFDFSRQLKSALKQQAYKTMDGVSTQYNNSFKERMTGHMKMLEATGHGLAANPDITKDSVIKFLQGTVDSSAFQRANLTNRDGIGYTNEGVKIDISDRDYFKKALQGINTVSEPLNSILDGSSVLILAVPISENHEIVGVLSGVYPIDLASETFMDNNYYGNEYGFILSENGDIIFASEHSDKMCISNNLLSFLADVEFDNYSLGELKTAMSKQETGNFTFTYNGSKRYVNFIPSGTNEWYTITMKSDSISLQEETIVQNITLNIVLKLSFLFLIILVLIFLQKKYHEKQLLAASEQYQSLLNNINGGMIVASYSKKQDEILARYVSSGFTDMTGYTLEDIETLYSGRYLDLIINDDRKTVFDKFLEQTKTGNIYRISYRLRKKDGSSIWIMDNGYIVKNENGISNHSIITDVSVIKHQETELRLSEKRFSIALNASGCALFEVDLKNQLYTHFENAERIFGEKAEKLLSDLECFSLLPYNEFIKSITNYFFHPDDFGVVRKGMIDAEKNGISSYEARLRRFDNSYIWAKIDLSLSLDESGKPSRLIGLMSDINDIKKHAEVLENQVQTDPMTGLYNKTASISLCDQVFKSYPGNLHALIVLDVDNFKGVNDTLGHVFGDAVLMDVADKLKQLLRLDDVIGRIGGDEFLVLMKNVPSSAHVFKKLAEISGVFHQTFIGEQNNYKISCSMGVAMFNNQNDRYATLFPKADAALYEAKKRGKDTFVVYEDIKEDEYPIINTSPKLIENLDSQKNINQQVFDLLYEAKDFSGSINMALSLIGRQYNISRVYVFECCDNNTSAKNIFLWCAEGITKPVDNFQLLNNVENYLACFGNDGLFYCNDIRNLSPFMRNILEPQKIRATLQLKVLNGDLATGFIGFDDCNKYRIWTADEISTLSFLSKMIDIFILKNNTEIALRHNLNNRLKILNTLPDYICVVNPETHSLEYANDKMQALIPDAKHGAFCFKTLRGGQKEPCETCLVDQLRNGDLKNVKITSEDKNIQLIMDATYINWSDRKKMVLFYGKEQ